MYAPGIGVVKGRTTELGEAVLAWGIRTARRDPLRRRIVSGLTSDARRVLAPRLRDLACPLRVFRTEALARLKTLKPLFDGAHRWPLRSSCRFDGASCTDR